MLSINTILDRRDLEVLVAKNPSGDQVSMLYAIIIVYLARNQSQLTSEINVFFNKERGDIINSGKFQVIDC